AAKADLGLVDDQLLERVYLQMAALNKYARDIMVRYPVNSCTDVTGFSLLGHSYEMAQGSGVTIHIQADSVPYHKEALELAGMGLIPAGAYRNREYASAGVLKNENIPLALEDIFYDPQTSGGLLFALPREEADACIKELQMTVPDAAIIGYVTEKEEADIIIS
ncbi:MAG: AIR synthase-related protein, partial [Lachnospiraceae bacterium]|nr:AIR synthase-related protein [Lachnospiraceae bacterium]